MMVRRVLFRFLGGCERAGDARARGMPHGDLPFDGGWTWSRNPMPALTEVAEGCPSPR